MKGRLSSKESEGNCLDLDDEHLLSKKKGIRLPGSKEPPELREIPEEASPSPSPRSTASGVTERSTRSLVEPVAEVSRGPEAQRSGGEPPFAHVLGCLFFPRPFPAVARRPAGLARRSGGADRLPGTRRAPKGRASSGALGFLSFALSTFAGSCLRLWRADSDFEVLQGECGQHGGVQADPSPSLPHHLIALTI